MRLWLSILLRRQYVKVVDKGGGLGVTVKVVSIG